MKIIAALVLTLVSTTSMAGGFTNWAIPTRVDVVRNEGLMVYGSFGNASNCTEADLFFVPITDTQYSQIYATIMMAFIAGKQISAYSIECDPETWYSVSTTTYNTVTTSGAVNVQN